MNLESLNVGLQRVNVYGGHPRLALGQCLLNPEQRDASQRRGKPAAAALQALQTCKQNGAKEENTVKGSIGEG